MKIDLGFVHFDIQLQNVCNKEYESCKKDVRLGYLTAEDIASLYLKNELDENYAKNEEGTITISNHIRMEKQKGRKKFLEEFGLLKDVEYKLHLLKDQKEPENDSEEDREEYV